MEEFRDFRSFLDATATEKVESTQKCLLQLVFDFFQIPFPLASFLTSIANETSGAIKV